MSTNENLQLLLQKLNLSQRQFAQRIRLDPGYFSRIIQGQACLNPRIQLLIENTFNVNGEWLTNGTGEIFRDQDDSGVKKEVIEAIDTLDNGELALVNSFIRYLKGKKEG